MDQPSTWNIILAGTFRRLLVLDIEHCSPSSLRSIILDVRTPAPILDSIAQAYCADENTLRELVRCPNLDETTLAFIVLSASEEMKDFIAKTRAVEVVVADAPPREEKKAPSPEEPKKLNVMQLILRMSPAQKIKLALTGPKEARGILIRESSKIIAMAVLSNPRITVGEVEFFAKSQNLSEDIMRKIGNNTEWSKLSSVYTGLVNNPKTPVTISLGFINRLSDRDLGILERSRNIPAPLRTAARNYLLKKKMGKK